MRMRKLRMASSSMQPDPEQPQCGRQVFVHARCLGHAAAQQRHLMHAPMHACASRGAWRGSKSVWYCPGSASNHPYRDFLAQLPTASRRSLTQHVLVPTSGTYRDGAFNLAGATPLRFGTPAETHGQQRHACVHSLRRLRPWPPVDNTVAGSSSGCSRRRARRRAVGKTGPALYRAGRCAAVRAAARGMEIGRPGNEAVMPGCRASMPRGETLHLSRSL